jgi:hypothetical protein
MCSRRDGAVGGNGLMGRGRAQKTLDLIAVAREILVEIQPASVRAVAYKLFSQGRIANMGKAETNKVSRLLRLAREAGDIAWEWVVDGTRPEEALPAWEDLEEYGEAVLASYRKSWWQDQPSLVQVWSEKDTVAGTLRPVLQVYQVPFRNMRGFTSATVAHGVAERTRVGDQPWRVLYVGDWDPSGLFMSEVDIPKRLMHYGASADTTVERVALTADDTEALGARLSFLAATKDLDPRYGWFTARYGGRCWELDALDPAILRERVEHAIANTIDQNAWRHCQAAEQVERQSLRELVARWPGAK